MQCEDVHERRVGTESEREKQSTESIVQRGTEKERQQEHVLQRQSVSLTAVSVYLGVLILEWADSESWLKK